MVISVGVNASVQNFDVKRPMPRRMTFANGHFIQYTYDADGNKLQVKYMIDNRPIFAAATVGETDLYDVDTSDTSLFETEWVRDYDGPYVYFMNDLERVLTPTGNYSPYKGFQHFIKNHNGDIVDIVPNTDDTYWETYYPFGGMFYFGEANARYRFSGKEFDYMNGLNWYDFHARHYDPVIAQFFTPDPLAELDYAISPYAFCRNNPIRLTDPTGMRPTNKEAAQIAAHVYGDEDVDLSGGWSLIGDIVKQENGLQYGIYGRELEDGSADYVLAFAGTDVKDYNDLINNINQSFGWSKISQYKEALPIAYNFMNYFSFGDQTIVGHSLGGGLAASASMHTGLPAITFNPAALSNKTKIRLNIYGNNTNQIQNYIVSGDIVTYLQSLIGLKADGITHIIPCNYSDKKTIPIGYEHSITTVIKSLRQ